MADAKRKHAQHQPPIPKPEVKSPNNTIRDVLQEAFIKATGQPLPGRALEELMNYPLEYVLTKIAMVEVGKRKINAPGWLLEACREDYRHLPATKKDKKATGTALKLSTAEDDKYRDLYRLVSEEEAARIRAKCRSSNLKPVDKYCELFRFT